MSGLVGNPNSWFSHAMAHMLVDHVTDRTESTFSCV